VNRIQNQANNRNCVRRPRRSLLI